MKCPECASESTRKFEIVYEEGTTEGTATHSSGDETEVFSQTPLAKRCSPPEDPSPGVLLSLIGFVIASILAIKLGTALGSFLLGLITIPVTLYALYVFWKRVLARQAFVNQALAYEKWKRSWLCIRCGHAFVDES